MEFRYSAFISYRHHPRDIRAAEQIQRGLEHYRVPRALRRQGRTIARLFRDKEELPITGDLSATIRQALAASRFLIVICSPHTRESDWVRREIACFLETHSPDRVLTVLTGGEPEQVIPEALRRRPAAGPEGCQKVEPLSCDWRSPRRRTRRAELTRLAAALLGCGYDELRQREKQYRTRRLIAALSVCLAGSVGFGAYFVHTSLRIRQNLEAALLNQSRYLADASLRLGEEGDRLQALQLALEALPEPDSPRPYLARAEYALSQAVGAWSAEQQPQVQRALTCGAPVQRIALTGDQKTLYAVDRRDELTIWQPDTARQTAALSLPGSPRQLWTTAAGNLLVRDYEDRLLCFDAAGACLWQAEAVGAAALSRQGDLLLTLEENRLRLLDPDTGLARQPDRLLQPPEAPETARLRLMQDRFDPSLPVPLEQYDHFAGSRLLSLDLASGQLRQLDAFSPEELFRCTAVTPGGDLLLMTTDKAHLASEAMGDQYARTPGVSRLYGYRDGQRLWAAEATTYAYTPLCALEPLGEYGLLWLVDDRLCRLDPDTGRELAACPLGSPPVWLEAGPESASLLLADGSAGSYSYRSGQFTARRCCAGPLQTGLGGDALLAVPENSPRILLYGYLRDENWQPLPGESPGAGQNYQVRGSRIVLQGLDGLVMLDTAGQTRLWELPGADPYGSSLLGFSADGQEVWLADHRNARLLRLDARTGTAQPVFLPDQAQGLPLTWEGPDAWPQTDGQRVFLLAQGQNGDTGGLFLAVWDSETGRTSVQPVGSQPAAGSRLLGARNGTAWLWNAADQTVCRVEADGRVQVLQQQVTEPPAARVLDESGLLALCQADRVLLFEENGPPRTLYTDGRRPVDCRLQDGVLLVLTGEATLLRLDPAEGRVLGETELEVYETYFSRFDSRYHTSRIHWEMVDEDTLFLDLFGAGNLLHTGQWERQGVVLDCAGCLPEAGLVLTERWVETERRLGSFPLYSLEQLQAMGRRALADGGTE